MAQWLRAPDALPEDPSSDPTSEGAQAPVTIADYALWPLRAPYICYIYINTYKVKNPIFRKKLIMSYKVSVNDELAISACCSEGKSGVRFLKNLNTLA